MKEYTVKWPLEDGRELIIETGRVAKQANGAVVVRLGDTMVLVTAVMSPIVREGTDFFPLTCDFEERMYAAGKIPGSFSKREGRPTEKAILTARLMDRPIRPLFPEGMRNDVQIIGMPLSVDMQNPPDVLAMIGASSALAISDIPFDGPIGAVRVGLVEGRLIAFPTYAQLEQGDLDLVVAGTKEAITTIEAGALQVTEAEVLDAIAFGHQIIRRIIELQERLVEEVGRPKATPILITGDPLVLQAVRDTAGEEIFAAIQNPDKVAREAGITELQGEIFERLLPQFPDKEMDLALAVDKVVKEAVRRLVLDYGRRPDGRKVDEVRPISCEVGVCPRVHGSALFTRGQTQVLTTVTLGSLEEEQVLDSISPETSKRFIHHYNFPPFSVGECRPLRGPGRREIGHGALAERAIRGMIPSTEDFPYVIRLVSEVLESNGSTSMASVCGSTLALMDAGVKITAPVAGIAMGLMTEGDRYAVLTDIQGMEDFGGDMDFKVAGTQTGITALQMDCKIRGVSLDILRDGLEQARQARLYILDKMLATIPAPRETLSPYAPRIFIVEIHPDKIGDVIGPGGKVIKKIQAETGAKIEIEQDGKVYIACVDAEAGERAKRMIEDITREVRVGEIYPGRVTRLMNFGAFVEILPGREGLLRLTELGMPRVRRIEEALHVGDEILVRVAEIDAQGRINLTCKGIPTAEAEEEREPVAEISRPSAPQPDRMGARPGVRRPMGGPPRSPAGPRGPEKPELRGRKPTGPGKRDSEPGVGVSFRPKRSE